VRSKLIGEFHDRLSRGTKDRQEEYRATVPSRLRPELDSLVKELAKRRTTKAGRKEYDFLIYPYFSTDDDCT